MPSSRSSAKRPFVDLDRQFREWSPATILDNTAAKIFADYDESLNQSFDWPKLLDRRRVVLLAEPGSGKTREIQMAADRLAAQGSTAFFVRLERLIAAPLEQVLYPDEATDFRHWKRSSRDAHFFLDSVDEAKIVRSADFYTAIARFADGLGEEAMRRAFVTITSRVSEWHHDVDLTEVGARLLAPVGSTQEQSQNGEIRFTKPETILVVRMEPLNRVRAEKFARHLGIANVQAFITAIDEAFAWEFARRPLDVMDLAAFWGEAGRLGTLTEIVTAHVRRNLRENPDREREARAPLSDDETWTGAAALGAATQLCRNGVFKVISEGDGLDATACLPAAWTIPKTAALLARPLFDDASFGKRQFHHRRAAEFLAATWLTERMLAGCTIRQLREILIEDIGAGSVLRPELDPIAGWLCSDEHPWSADVREWVLRAQPEIHLSWGDPSRLPPQYRRRVLEQIAANYAGRSRALIAADDQALVRLGHPEIAPDISRLILDPHVVVEFRWHLMRMAAVCRLAGCADAALAVLLSPDNSDDLRAEAVDVIYNAGSEELRRRVVELLPQFPAYGSSFAHYFVRAAYPTYLGNADLVELAANVHERDFPIFPGTLARRLQEVLQVEAAGDLLDRFLTLIQREPTRPAAPGTIPISLAHGKNIDVLPAIVVILLRASVLSERDTRNAALALLFVGSIHHNVEQKDRDALIAASEGHPPLRRVYFLRCIELTRQIVPGRLAGWYLHPFHHETLLKPISADLEWLADELRAAPDSASRRMFLSLAFELWMQAGRPRHYRKRLAGAIHDDVELSAQFKTWLRQARRAPLVGWFYRMFVFRFGHRWWWLGFVHSWSRRRTAMRNFFVLHRELRSLCRGTNAQRLCAVIYEADERGRDRWIIKSWSSIGRKFGPLVQWATRRGCRLIWRRYVPTPPSARANSNSTPPEVIAGLNGLQIEADTVPPPYAFWSEDDVRRAALYAVNELNMPAPWLDTLASERPQGVISALQECIRDEWSSQLRGTAVFGVLSKVLARAQTLGALMQPEVISLLEGSDPRNPGLLEFALRLVVPARPPRIGALAPQRSRREPLSAPATALWSAAWLRLEPVGCLAWLAALSETDPTADHLVVGIAAQLHGGNLFQPLKLEDAAFLEPRILARMIAIFFRRIRVSEDVHHQGTFTPAPRDYAQEFRNSLLSAMGELRGPEVAGLLTQLADDPALADVRDSILSRRDGQLRAQARAAAWRQNDLREFAVVNETAPRNDTDLFKIALKRLDDIKYAVESSDQSIRAHLRPEDNEVVLRRFLAAELGVRSRDRYTEPQESVIDDERRPDIRLENPAFPGPISIEVKWAENWTVAELLERLENQLVGTYLRSRENRHGIFLLGMIGREGKNRWANPDGGARLTFAQVTAAIRNRSAQLQAQYPQIWGLEVVTIDFRPRAAWE